MKQLLQLFICSFLLSISLNTSAQMWNTVGNGLINYPGNSNYNNVATSDTNGVYVAYTFTNGGQVRFTVGVWNGFVWNFSKSVASGLPRDIKVIGTDIFVCTNSGTLRKFDGTNWSVLTPPGMVGGVYSIEVYIGNLVCAGDFTANNGIVNIMTYNGLTFSALPPLPWLDWIGDVEEANGELFITGNATTNPPIDSTFLKLNASNLWEGPAHFIQGTGSVANMTSYNNEILFYSGSSLYRSSNDTIKPLGSAGNIISNTAEFNGELYMTHYNLANGITKFDGMGFSFLPFTPTYFFGLAVYKSDLFAFSSNQNVYNGILHNRAYRTDGITAILNGNVYLDVNTNCVKDPNDIVIQNALVSVDSSFVISSNVNGQFSLGLTPGIHTVDSVLFVSPTSKNLFLNCNIPAQVNVLPSMVTTVDLGLAASVATDAIVSINPYWGWRARYGFTDNYAIKIYNSGAATLYSTTLHVECPPSVAIDSIYPVPSTQSGGNLTFNLSNIPSFQSESLFIRATIDTALNSINDTIYWKAWFDSIPGEADYSDNFDTVYQQVRGAYDPNDKQASAQYISPGTDEIDYHIRFQNTGNDTAYKVVVVDSIDLSLPLTSIYINSASHPYNFTVQGNVLIWEFDNILLPDSAADLIGSQGYVNFTAKINPNLNLGDTIKNDADIYFDFQHPIHTNTAKTFVVSGFAIVEDNLAKSALKVYPNPAKDVLVVVNDSYEPRQVQLLDLQGRVLETQELMPQEELRLSISQLSAGMYLITTKNESHKVMVVE